MLSRRLGCAAMLVLAGAACGTDAQPAVPAGHPIGQEADDPLAGIPRSELYGATPVENMWSPQIELDVLELPPGWQGARFAILSDFQLGAWEGNDEVAVAAVQRAVEAEPDLILLLGGYVARGEETAAFERALAPLRGRRAIAVLGARDVRSDTVEARVTRALQANGVEVLRNSAAAIVLGGDTAMIAGLDPDLLTSPWGDQQWVLSTLGVAGRTPILMTHAPALVTRAPNERFPITLAGNTFCGQVEVPGSPRLSWLRSEVFPGGSIEGTDRLFRIQGSTVFVTCGIGFGFVPLRFGAAPEVPILTLLRVGAPAPVTERAAVEDTLIQQFQGTPADPP